MAHDPDVLRGLLEQIGALTAPSRDVDEAIMAALYQRDELHIGEEADDGPNGSWVKVKTPVWVDPRTDRWVTNHAFRFTEAADAAERLVSWLPGGWQISTTTPDPTRPGHGARAWAKVQPHQMNDEGWKIGARDATGVTVPLALSTAALMALTATALAQRETSDVR